jgi:hypothetical protein
MTGSRKLLISCTPAPKPMDAKVTNMHCLRKALSTHATDGGLWPVRVNHTRHIWTGETRVAGSKRYAVPPMISHNRSSRRTAERLVQAVIGYITGGLWVSFTEPERIHSRRRTF